MGLLDDAIREHLDLKRRRGADPTEVERAEREALGPVRRGVEPAEEVGSGAEGPPEDPIEGAADHAGTESGYAPAEGPAEPAPLTFDSAETPAPEAPPETAEASPAPSALEPPPPAAPPLGAAPPPAAAESPTPPAPAPADRAPEPVHAPRPLADPDEAGGETVEYDVEHALEHEPKRGSDDVLEETPEFLQDTPDHDRLWFEQRPPRDFDFDG